MNRPSITLLITSVAVAIGLASPLKLRADETGACCRSACACQTCGGLHGTGQCAGPRGCGPRGMGSTWNGAYYKPEWGMPAAVIVPPTAETQSHYSWGVGGYRVTPICPMFHRDPAASTYDRRLFRPTPAWPSSTDQMGVYYVRGPW